MQSRYDIIWSNLPDEWSVRTELLHRSASGNLKASTHTAHQVSASNSIAVTKKPAQKWRNQYAEYENKYAQAEYVCMNMQPDMNKSQKYAEIQVTAEYAKEICSNIQKKMENMVNNNMFHILHIVICTKYAKHTVTIVNLSRFKFFYMLIYILDSIILHHI